MATAALLGASLAISAVGSGIQYYSQQQQANNAQKIADYNYQIAQSNAATSSKVIAQQQAWNNQAASLNYQAQQNNARQLDYEADAVSQNGAQEVSRQRDRNARLLATQRAQYAKSGVTTEGSPLTTMAEQASILELGVQDMYYDSETKSRGYRDEAAQARYQSQFTLLDQAAQNYDAAAKMTGIGLDLQSARISKLSGYSTAQGERTAAYGTLINGLGSSISQTSNYYDRKNTNALYKAAA